MPTLTRLTSTTSALLLYLLTLSPPPIRTPILDILLPRTTTPLSTITSILKKLLAFSLILEINNLLNIWARNNWRLRNSSSEKWEWNKEIAVVTGGNGGIGSLIVEGLAERGVTVVVLDVSELPKRLRDSPKIHLYKCDITSAEEVTKVAADINSKLGHPTILINNAGLAHGHTLLEATPAFLEKLFNVNLISQFYTLQSFLPAMIKAKKGHVIFTASLASFATCCGLVDYAASKAGVMALHEGLQQELKWRYQAPEIKTSIVHPIYVRTPLVDSYARSLKRNKSIQIEPQEVADAVLRCVWTQKSQRIVVPERLSFLKRVRGWPEWMAMLVRDGARNDVLAE